MNILVIMTKNSGTRKKRGNKTKQPNRSRRSRRNHSHGSTIRTRVKRGGMFSRGAAAAAIPLVRFSPPTTILNIQEARTFFYHTLVPLFTTNEYHVISSDPNPADKQVVIYPQRHYNSQFPAELTSEFNQLKSVIDKTIKDESDPVQITAKVYGLYQKVKMALDDQEKRKTNENKPPNHYSPQLQRQFTPVQPQLPVATLKLQNITNTPTLSSDQRLGQFVHQPFVSPNLKRHPESSSAINTPPSLNSNTGTTNQPDFAGSPTNQHDFDGSPFTPFILYDRKSPPPQSPSSPEPPVVTQDSLGNTTSKFRQPTF